MKDILADTKGCGVYLFVKVDEDKIHMSCPCNELHPSEDEIAQSSNRILMEKAAVVWPSSWGGIGRQEPGRIGGCEEGEETAGRGRESGEKCKMLIFVIQ